MVKNKLSALCGSDLHICRSSYFIGVAYYKFVLISVHLADHGHQPVPNYDFILGHEFVGVVHEVGSDVKKFKKGDLVVSPFTISW